jgi:hypothetical protein
MPWAMHEMRSPYHRPVNEDHLSDNRLLMHNPTFHHRLNYTVNHCSFDNRLHDLSLDDPAFNDWTQYVSLDDPALDGGASSSSVSMRPRAGRWSNTSSSSIAYPPRY